MGGHGSERDLILKGIIGIFILFILNQPIPVQGIMCFECTGDEPQNLCTKVPLTKVNCGHLHCVTKTMQFKNGTRVTSRGCSACELKRESLFSFLDKTVGCPDNKCVLTRNKSLVRNTLEPEGVGGVTMYDESLCGCNYNLCNITPDCTCPVPIDPASGYYSFLVIFPICGLLLGFGFKYSDAVGLCLRTVTCRGKKEKIEYTGVTK